MVPVQINGRTVEAMIDTGAIPTVCTRAMARELGLVASGKTTKLVGVGRTTAHLSEPVLLCVADTTVRTQVRIVETFPVPLVLGMRDLRGLGRVDNKPAESVVSEVLTVDPKPGTFDVASGVEEGLSDSVLLSKGLKELSGKFGKDVTESFKREVLSLFEEYSDTWVRPRSGRYKGPPARIEVIGNPVRGRVRPLNPEMKEVVTEHIESQLRQGVLQSEWRVVVDFRAVNKRIKADAYPLPSLWGNIQDAAGHRYYVALDLTWGFWNLPLSEDSKEVTAILTHLG
ncbi:MAG: uncharacterized protein KVP18_004276, partial [Porospora cf. gigantea A]|uniref:uncharacterized protein n=1 Tax=Porospora cf. gigantea A TaxID=2853593 RepID=UPI003559BD9C